MKCTILFLSACVVFVESAKILCVFQWPFYSHQKVYRPLWKELSLRGHQVTVLTPSPLNDPSLVNLTEIDLSFSTPLLDAANVQNTLNRHTETTKLYSVLMDMVLVLSELQFNSTEVQKLIDDPSQEFDLVLIEYMFPIAAAFSARFNCPMVGIISLDIMNFGHDAIGNPTHPVLYPDVFISYNSLDLTLWDRIYNTYFDIWNRLFWKNTVLPSHDKLARKFFPDNLPYLEPVWRNLSLLFLKISPILNRNRPNVPSVVELWDLDSGLSQSLPQGLQEQLDEATGGAIYFSLGSHVKSANLTKNVKEVIFNVLKDLPFKVFWKWEADNLENKPKNVVIQKWYPQREILSHPNIKVFVTQGGIQSIEDGLVNKVPMVSIPFIGDQPRNSLLMAEKGIAITLDFNTMTSKQLKNAIMEVAVNPKYKKKVEEISQIISDQPMNGMDKFIWWIEYVIRHKGATHLRSPAVDLCWYQYYQVDVYGFALICFFLAFFITHKTTRFIVACLNCGQKIEN